MFIKIDMKDHNTTFMPKNKLEDGQFKNNLRLDIYELEPSSSHGKYILYINNVTL